MGQYPSNFAGPMSPELLAVSAVRMIDAVVKTKSSEPEDYPGVIKKSQY
jgi:hypothetical protein